MQKTALKSGWPTDDFHMTKQTGKQKSGGLVFYTPNRVEHLIFNSSTDKMKILSGYVTETLRTEDRICTVFFTEDRFCPEFCFLRHQSKHIQRFGVFCPSRDQVDPGGFDAAVAQHIGQLGDIPAGPVKCSGEQMAQIVRVYLSGIHARRLAELLHFRPYLPSGQAVSAFGEKDFTGSDFLFFGILN